MRPLGLTVLEKLLEHGKPNLAVIERIAQVSAFVDPSGWDPRKRESDKLFDLVASARPRICRHSEIWLLGQLVLLEHGAPVRAVVPDGNKNELRRRILFYSFQPAAAP